VAKLYFRYGTVSSAKTLNLLATAYKYEQQGKTVAVVKPGLDDRFGKSNVRSRVGLERKADYIIEDFSSFAQMRSEIYDHPPDCILVDEAQFLEEHIIDYFRTITVTLDLPVVAFGLRTNFKTKFFEGSRRLMELSDDIQEVKNICHFSNKKAIMNLKHVNNEPVFEGPSVELGAEEKYYPVSYEEYYKAYRKKYP